jgi:multiple sugar transport system substrate-binding protein
MFLVMNMEKERKIKSTKKPNELINKRLNRREALSTAGKIAITAVVVGVVAGVGGYLAGSVTAPPAAPQTVTTTVRVTQTVPTTITVGAPTTTTQVQRYITRHAQRPATTLIMNGWGYRPDVVKENIRIFNEQLNENAEYEVISGDYPALMESKFISGAKVDVLYGNPFHGARWYARGWIRSLTKVISERYGSDLYKKIISDMYPSVADGFTSTDGHLFALPYFTSARGNILYNELLTQKAGIDEPPASWWDLYEKIEIVKNKGVVDTPFLPHWFKEWFGMAWGWLFETMNRAKSPDGKDCLFDEDFNPVFGPDTEAGKVLKDWADIWKKGLVPKGVVTMTEADYLAAFGTGNFAYSPQQTYDLKTFNDPATSKFAGHCRLVPVKEHSWGLLDMGGYHLATPETDPDFNRALQLELWYGYRDINGVLFVAKKWAIETALNAGYREILSDPDVMAAYAKWMPYPEELEYEKKIMEVVPFPWIWKSPWYLDWQTKASDLLPLAASGQRSPEDVVKELYEYAKKVKAESGG